MSIAQSVVIIPFYKDTLNTNEEISLQQCEKILSPHIKIAIKPRSLTLPKKVSSLIKLNGVVNFDDHFFAGIAGYNRLMLSQDFYGQFLDYECLLIYQTDAFVFKDELDYWCSQGWDYIGAPWIRRKDDGAIKAAVTGIQQAVSTQFNLKKNGVPNKYQFDNKVGNGGFSLRRVNKFHELCGTEKGRIETYLAQTAHQYNEDAFWSVEANRKKMLLKIPDWQTALRFSFEIYPERALRLNNGELPFGCHDWDQYPEFWRPIFESQGYSL
ncbi:hypothetical protein MUY27_01855 [Mucilaginibacter sp. RS28]|uniref:DUF5672 domain-containing protein n=1 Tax=Mucilaginibacter straminoryzae TaxID=2932774 RepID=A0A9X1WZK6_9SPHI|nr:DUF5672 family protein [Mucilaginibacter straminoryzae]MCJ8208434.1 hypothetical protein [Mucilaginibacter straminoryzae]